MMPLQINRNTFNSCTHVVVMLLICTLTMIMSSCSDGKKKVMDDEMSERLSTALMKDTTSIVFDQMTHDFGDVMEGSKVEYTFGFVNTGKNDLLIATAFGSCGCTVPEYPEELIPAGARSQIKIIFNSEGRSGKQNKKVFIVANTNPKRTELEFTANIIEN